MPKDSAFWEEPAQVERFAGLEPDELLLELVSEYGGPTPLRALDLGCAGGRNAEALVRAGCETWALDLSIAMTQATRDRLAGLAAASLRSMRVVRGRLDRLPFADACFDFVVAIGIYVQANSDDELLAGMTETYRVLRANGRVLVSMWSKQTLPSDAERVAGQRFVYASQPGETRCRLTRDELIDLMTQAGMPPDRPVFERHPIRDGKPHVANVGVFAKR